jgi:tRNA-dihydrouridine synthase
LYQGKADWGAIARVKQAVSIPVVANGDVRSLAEASEILVQSGADAVMIGRASYGAPWTAGAIAEGAGNIPGAPRTARELADYVVAHYEDMLTLYGIESGLRQARKHLGWYLERHAKGIALELRAKILTSLEPAAVINALREALGSSFDLLERNVA